jgi:hypothetical protein
MQSSESRDQYMQVSKQVLASHLIVRKGRVRIPSNTFHIHILIQLVTIENMFSAIESELCALQRLFDQIKHHVKVIANAHDIMTRYLEGNRGVLLSCQVC